MFRSSPIPLWVTLFLMLLALSMSSQVYIFYLDHGFLSEAGISTEGAPNLNILYATAGRALAMIAATVLAILLQNPQAYLVILLMSMVREGQETIIQPLYPYANSPASPAVMFALHAVILAIEIAAFIAVLRKLRSTS